MAQPQQKTDRKFINAFFGKRVWRDGNDPDRELFSIGLKKADFLSEIDAIQEDDRGFINLTMGSQKADPSKMSLFEQEKKHDSAGGKQQTKYQSKSTPPSKSSPKQKEETAADDSDDLPF